ncbi:MAG: tetratricopeptide repeat protein [Pyrinomonadaceae bacterium]
MARKRRNFDQVQLPATDPKVKPKYEDPFQRAVGKKIEDAAGMFEGHGRNILYGLAAAVVLALVIWIIYAWSDRTSSEAQTALGKAIETSQAAISETPPLAGSTQKSFKTIRERSEAAIGEFQGVVSKFGGPAGEKAKYFIAVNRLLIDRPAGIQELQALSTSGGEVGSLSKFALAQTRAEDGQTDDAIKLYEELNASSDPVVAKETIQFELAKVYEKAGRKDDAVSTLFDLVKTASEAKDLEGKSVPLTQTAQSAKDKLKELDPAKAQEIPEPAPETPGGPAF